MSDVWTIVFDREGRPVGVTGPKLPVPDGGREHGMATMQVVPLAPLERECSGPYQEAQRAAGEFLDGGWESIRDHLFADEDVNVRANLMRTLLHGMTDAALRWRRDLSRRAAHRPYDAEDIWGVK